MRCRNNLDERQLLQRGNVFQHTLILLVVLLIANAFLKEEGIVWAEGSGSRYRKPHGWVYAYFPGGNGSGSGIPDRDIFDVCFPKAVSQKEEGRRR